MRSRSVGAGAAAALLLLSVTGPATAAPEDYGVSTSGSGIMLTVLGQPALELASTTASADATPTAKASGLAAAIGGTEVPGTSSAVDITSGTSTDGANCALPALPAELAAFVSVAGLCSTSTATISGLPTSRAEAGLGALSVDATALVGAITALILEPINAGLTDVFETVENTVNSAVQDALEAACATDALPLDQVQGIVEDILGDALDPITSNLPDNDACAVLLQFISDAPQLSDVQAAVDALVAALLDAIGDLASIDVSLNATSQVENVGGILTATSGFGEISLELPSLDILGAVVALAFEGPVGDYLGELTDLVSGLAADAPEIPDLAATITDVLDTLGLSPLLVDPAPLLKLDVVGSRSTVAVDTAATTVTPTAVAGSITATISPALATLLGIPETTTVAPGDEAILGEGTPLETRLAVGAASTTADSASGELVTVELLRTIESGVVLTVGATNATGAALAPVTPAPTPAPEPLPVTGGGAMLAALASLGAARGLRKR